MTLLLLCGGGECLAMREAACRSSCMSRAMSWRDQSRPTFKQGARASASKSSEHRRRHSAIPECREGARVWRAVHFALTATTRVPNRAVTRRVGWVVGSSSVPLLPQLPENGLRKPFSAAERDSARELRGPALCKRAPVSVSRRSEHLSCRYARSGSCRYHARAANPARLMVELRKALA
jgi:hypothetical protein